MVAQAGFVFWTRIHTPRVAPGALPREIDLLPSTWLVGGQTWVGFRVAIEGSILVAQAGFVFWTRISDAPQARAPRAGPSRGAPGAVGREGAWWRRPVFFWSRSMHPIVPWARGLSIVRFKSDPWAGSSVSKPLDRQPWAELFDTACVFGRPLAPARVVVSSPDRRGSSGPPPHRRGIRGPLAAGRGWPEDP